MGDHPRKRTDGASSARSSSGGRSSGFERREDPRDLSRELNISPSVFRRWKRFAESGATTAVQASEDVVPASQLREAYAKIRERERALGRKTMENEILRAAQEVKKTPSLRRASGR
jgi:transposase